MIDKRQTNYMRRRITRLLCEGYGSEDIAIKTNLDLKEVGFVIRKILTEGNPKEMFRQVKRRWRLEAIKAGRHKGAVE